MMLRILAVEQLTGAARTQSTAISAAATQAAIDNNKEAITLSQQLKDRAERSEAVTSKNLETLEAIDPKREICRDGQSIPSAEVPADATADQKAAAEKKVLDWKQCDIANRNYKDAKAQSDRHNNQLSLALTASGKAGATSASAVSDSLVNFNDDTSDNASPRNIASVAEAVLNIATLPSVDEALMFCLAYLDSSSQSTTVTIPRPDLDQAVIKREPYRERQTTDACVKILAEKARGDKEVALALAGKSPAASFRRGKLQPKLFAYLDASGLKADELMRRYEIAGKAAEKIGFGSSIRAVTNLVAGGSDEDHASLIGAIKALETSEDAKKVFD